MLIQYLFYFFFSRTHACIEFSNSSRLLRLILPCRFRHGVPTESTDENDFLARVGRRTFFARVIFVRTGCSQRELIDFSVDYRVSRGEERWFRCTISFFVVTIKSAAKTDVRNVSVEKKKTVLDIVETVRGGFYTVYIERVTVCFIMVPTIACNGFMNY